MRNICKKLKIFLLVAGVLIFTAFVVLTAEMVWPSSPISLLLDKITVLGYPLSGYSEQISLMVLREESEKIETEPDILLVTLRGQPGWSEEWQDIAKTAFQVLPSHLKNMATRERPLQLVIKRGMRNDASASFNPVANTIIINWGNHEKLPASEKKRVLLSTIFHEVGHAVDASYKDGARSWPKNKWLSYNGWKSFLGADPDLKAFLEKQAGGGDLYLESFAIAFQQYITDEVFGSSSILDRIPESRPWLKIHIFQEEPKREFLIKFLTSKK